MKTSRDSTGALAVELSEAEARHLLFWVVEKGAHREASVRGWPGMGYLLFDTLNAVVIDGAETVIGNV